jgi:hypothetical protein
MMAKIPSHVAIRSGSESEELAPLRLWDSLDQHGPVDGSFSEPPSHFKSNLIPENKIPSSQTRIGLG